MLHTLGQTTSHSLGKSKVNELRRDAQHGSVYVGKHASNDPYFLNLNADQKEQKMIKMTQKLPGEYQKEHLEHIPGVSTIKIPDQNQLTKQNLTAAWGDNTINQRVAFKQIGGGAQSIARTSNI